MSENVAWGLQKSIYSALNASPHIISHVGQNSIYDDVPRSAIYPYISFGQNSVRDLSGSGERGFVHSLELNVWSKGNGKKEVFDIMQTVRTALSDPVLSVSGFHVVNMRCEQSSVKRNQKSQSYHGVMRYRVVTEAVTLER